MIKQFPFNEDGYFDKEVTPEGVVKLGEEFGEELLHDESENLIWFSSKLYERHKNYLLQRSKKLDKDDK